MIILIAVLCRVLYAQAHPQADYTVCLLTARELSDKVSFDLSEMLSPLVGDLDGNGTAVCQVEQKILGFPFQRPIPRPKCETTLFRAPIR